jgi:ferredoxin
MIIDPETCIDCGACLPECPIGAIIDSADGDPEYAKINADLTESYKGNPAAPLRPSNDPPRRPENKLVN